MKPTPQPLKSVSVHLRPGSPGSPAFGLGRPGSLGSLGNLGSLCSLLLFVLLSLVSTSCSNHLPGADQPPAITDTPDGLRPEDYVGRPVEFGGFTVTEVTMDATTRATTRTTTRAFGQGGEVVTIEMWTMSQDASVSYLADYVLSADGSSLTPVDSPTNKPLCWQDADLTHTFTAYHPALTQAEKISSRAYGTLPLDWTEEHYRYYDRLMQSPSTSVDIGHPVSLALKLLLTRIEVTIDPTTAPTDATHLTMRTKNEYEVSPYAVASPKRNARVADMNLWLDPQHPFADGTTAPAFCGYTVPQTYAPGTVLMKHHTPGDPDARTYIVAHDPAYPNGLTTLGGQVFTFQVSGVHSRTGVVNVPTAGGLKAAMATYLSTHSNIYPERLKLTGQMGYNDMRYLTDITAAGAAGTRITAVDMEGATAVDDSFVDESRAGYFISYSGSIKHLVLPSSMRTISDNIFNNSTLATVVLPRELEKIEPGAFKDCQGLKSITIPASVNTIEAFAFSGSGLTSIVLPEGLTKLQANVFKDCKALQKVALSGDKAITIGSGIFEGTQVSDLFLYAPGLDASSSIMQGYISGSWGGITWSNIYWGYKGTGDILDPNSYEHHEK